MSIRHILCRKVRRFAAAIALAFSLAVALSCPGLSAPSPTLEEIVESMTVAQSGLFEWAADVSMQFYIGSLLVPVRTKLFCRRPSKAALRFGSITIHPPGGFLLPDPMQFSDSKCYEVALTETRIADGIPSYTLEARPKDPKQHTWRFTVNGSTWLIYRAYAHSGMDESDLHIVYKNMGARIWVPASISGSGVLVLKDSLPPLIAASLVSLAGKQGVKYRVTLENHRVNGGVPDSVFKKD